MPVVRRGEVPHPPTGVGEHPDELYTQKGFFGDWVHVYRRHNPGVPLRWSDDELIYAGIDVAGVEAPATLIEGDGVRVSLSRGAPGVTERNLDFHEIRFYHRGAVLLETELGELEASEGDFVVVGKGLVYRETPRTDDLTVVIFESAEPVQLAESMWDGVGFASLFIDYSGLVLPTPGDASGADRETEVRVRYEGRTHSMVYAFDPCRDVTGWVGDPVIYRLNIWDVPGIGTNRGFLPPPAHAVLMGENKSWFFNVLSPSPFPSEGSYGAPAHFNDYDEVWLNHVSEARPDNDGHMWLFPRTLPHPGLKGPPRYPPNPPQRLREIKINFDTRARLRFTGEALAAKLPGDVRETVFTSLYGLRRRDGRDRA